MRIITVSISPKIRFLLRKSLSTISIRNIAQQIRGIIFYIKTGAFISFPMHRYDMKMTCSLSFDETFQEDLLFEMLCKKYDLRGTLYAVHRQVLEGGWWDSDPLGGEVTFECWKGYTRRLTLSEEQLKEIDGSGTFTVSSHSYSHLKAELIEDAEAKRWEIVENRRWLERLLKKPIMGFAYPYGNMEAEYSEIVRENHLYGRCTVGGGVSYNYPERTLAILKPTTSLHYVNNPNARRKFFSYSLYPRKLFDEAYKYGGWFRVYGHSETDTSLNNSWKDLDEFFSYINKKNGIHHCPYEEAIGYQLAVQSASYRDVRYSPSKKTLGLNITCENGRNIPATVKIRFRDRIWKSIYGGVGVKVDGKNVPVRIDPINKSIIFEVGRGNHRISVSDSHDSPNISLSKPEITDLVCAQDRISWKTNCKCDGVVYYSTKKDPGITDWKIMGRKPGKTLSHQISVPESLRGVFVNYVIASTDEKGFSGWSDNEGNYYQRGKKDKKVA